MNAHKILAFSLGPIGAAVLGLVTLPIITWLFSPEDIGRLTMVQVTVSFSLLVFSLGLDQAYVREFHEVQDKQGLFKLVFAPGFMILLVVLTGLALSTWSPSFLLFGIDSLFLNALLYASILLSFGIRFLSLILRMQERGLAFSIGQLLSKLLFLIIVVGYAGLDTEAIFEYLIMANFLALLTVFMIYAWNTRKDWLPAFRSTIDKTKQAQMISYGIPLIGSGVAFWGLTNMDRMFLRSLSSFEELGVYSVSVSFAGVALVFQSIFSTVWIPVVYKWAAEGIDPIKIKNITDYVTLGVVMIWSLTGIFSWMVNYILPPEYNNVQYTLLAAMAYPLLYTLSEATSVGIGIRRKMVFSLLSAIVALIANTISNWVLIPLYGASGAAMASMVAFFIFFAIRTEASSKLWISFERWRMYGLIIGLVLLSLVSNILKMELFFLVNSYFIFSLLGLLLFKQQTKVSVYYILTKLKLRIN